MLDSSRQAGLTRGWPGAQLSVGGALRVMHL
jgi:hypothetical protein